jgi:hypothetical protein
LITCIQHAQGSRTDDQQSLAPLLDGKLDAEVFACETRTLSNVIDSEGITNIDLLKIDAEKSELDVLLGIRREHWHYIRQIVAEVQDSNGRVEAVKSLLSENGFSVHVEQEYELRDTGLFMIYARAQRARIRTNVERSEEHPQGVRHVIFGGEALEPGELDRWLARHEHTATAVNMYGITETTVHSTYRRLRREDLSSLSVRSPIGHPLPGVGIMILDRNMQLLPVGIPGEIYVAGTGLSRGYLRRAGLTAERFIPNPFSTGTGERMYRSGDLGRYLSDGSIDFLGRCDTQVKLRGHRIELGEVEAAIREHTGVTECAADVRELQTGDQRLVVWYVPKSAAVSESALRIHLRQLIPAYMIPSAFVELSSLPRSPNGKIDRKALLLPSVRPRNSMVAMPLPGPEEKIAVCWQSVLKTETVGRHENFFEAGGHSLLLPVLLGKLQEALSVELDLVDLFEYPTVASLGQALSRRARTTITTVQGAEDAAIRAKELAQTGQQNLVRQRELRARAIQVR